MCLTSVAYTPCATVDFEYKRLLPSHLYTKKTCELKRLSKDWIAVSSDDLRFKYFRLVGLQVEDNGSVSRTGLCPHWKVERLAQVDGERVALDVVIQRVLEKGIT